jgi:hypothetical protein
VEHAVQGRGVVVDDPVADVARVVHTTSIAARSPSSVFGRSRSVS